MSKLAVLAQNGSHAKNWANMYKIPPRNFFYVSSADSLRGLEVDDYFIYPSAREHKDFTRSIFLLKRVIGATEITEDQAIEKYRRKTK